MKARVLLIGLLALASAGCITPEAMGRMRGLRADSLMKAPQITEVAGKARRFGISLAGALTVLLGFSWWHRTMHGGEGGQGVTFTRPLVGYTAPIIACAYILATTGKPAGIDQLLLDAGLKLGDELHPGTREPLRAWTDMVSTVGRLTQKLFVLSDPRNRPGSQETTPEERTAMAVAGFYGEPFGANLLFLNGVAVWFMALMAQAALAWLLAFYFALGPLLAPTLILPSTQGIFIGWLKAYVSLCLWPGLFGIMERIFDALPWATFFSTSVDSVDLLTAADAVTQGMGMMFLGNLLFFFAYLSVPFAAYGLVGAASRPFRGITH